MFTCGQLVIYDVIYIANTYPYTNINIIINNLYQEKLSNDNNGDCSSLSPID